MDPEVVGSNPTSANISLLIFHFFSYIFLIYRSPAIADMQQYNPRNTLYHQQSNSPSSNNNKRAKFEHDKPRHCRAPKQNIIFVKSHKTGSSTVSTTLIRYAEENQLKLAMPIFTHIFHEVHPFNHRMVLSIGDMKQFNILTNHARYNRFEMSQVVHRAIYVTIIRNPIHQLESAFSYFGMAQGLGLSENNGLDEFLEKPKYYFNNQQYHMREQSWNGQIFDLGLDHKYHLNDSAVQHKIKQLSKEIDLVMIKEYFDHSMVLLRHLLCWDWMDVVYISKAVRAKQLRYDITNTLTAKIKRWNAADVKLYKHFNRTFWRKIKQYGSNFNRDLKHFQDLNRHISSLCIDTDSNSNYDMREDAHSLRPDAPPFCFNLKQDEVPFIRWIKWHYVCRHMLVPSFIILVFICVSVYSIKHLVFRRGFTKVLPTEQLYKRT